MKRMKLVAVAVAVVITLALASAGVAGAKVRRTVHPHDALTGEDAPLLAAHAGGRVVVGGGVAGQKREALLDSQPRGRDQPLPPRPAGQGALGLRRVTSR